MVAEHHPLVVISILNWNGWQDTIECLESVRRLDYPNFLAVVVDNGSRNGSADKIKAWAEANLGPGHVIADYSRETALAGGAPETEQALEGAASSARLVLIRNKENLGFTGGNNLSIEYALARDGSADFVFLLNNDCSVSPTSLRNLLLVAGKAEAGIVEATIFDGESLSPHAPCRPAHWQEVLDRLLGNKPESFASCDEYSDTVAVRGAAALIRSKVLVEIFSQRREYLHQGFFMYQEDYGVSLRARRLGFRCVIANKAAVRHRGARSSGGKYNSLEYYYVHRNRLLLAKEMSTVGKFTVHVVCTPIAFARAIKCAAHGRYGAAQAVLWGVIDGYRGIKGKWRRHDRAVLCRSIQ